MFCQAICDGKKNDICLRTYTQSEHSIYLSGQFLQKNFLWTNGPPIPGMCNKCCLTFVLPKCVVQHLTSISIGRVYFSLVLSSYSFEYFQCCLSTNLQNAFLSNFVSFICF